MQSKKLNIFIATFISLVLLISVCFCGHIIITNIMDLRKDYNSTTDFASSSDTKSDNNEYTGTYYTVSNEYFTKADFFKYETSTYDTLKNSDYKRYWIKCSSSCSLSIFEYTVNITLYNSNNYILSRKKETVKENITNGYTFSLDIELSKQNYDNFSTAEVAFTGKTKTKPPAIKKKYLVTLVNNNGTPNSSTVITEGSTFATPIDPQKNNYLFCGWYTDNSFNYKYDFSRPIDSNLTLYAKYEIDARTLTNRISQDTIKGVVKIYNKSYNTFLGFETDKFYSQGSGFCFYISNNGYYYCLTNCHVAIKESGYDNQEFTVEDYQGNTYEAYLHRKNGRQAISASYDLACIYFKSKSTNVRKLSILYKNTAIGDDVIALGAPKNQQNTITFGKTLYYSTATLTDATARESNVKFNVAYHSAYINNGSSGGPILNSDLNVVGVNYASGTNNRGNSSVSIAIPAEKVREFLNEYVYE